jgi:hypothetical protein
MPTVTIGFGGRIAPGFTLGFDVGVGFQGKPKVESLVATGGTLSATPELQAELVKERAKIEDEIGDFDVWPIAQLSFLWRF